jgi:HlyD family secretion protein
MTFSFRYVAMSAVGLGALGAALYFLTPVILGKVVTPVSVTRGEIVQTIVASGRVETPSRISLGSQVTGTVATVSVAEGDSVQAGDLLFTLDDRDARAAVEQARANVRQAKGKLRLIADFTLPAAKQTLIQAKATRLKTERQLDRDRQLVAGHIVTSTTIDDAQSAFEIAQAGVEAAELAISSASPGGSEVAMAQASLELAKAALQATIAKRDLTRITSPADGLVIARNVEIGMVVQAGSAMMILAPGTAKRLVAQVDERSMSLISVGQPAFASADAYPTERFPAKVALISPAVDPDRGAVEVKLDLPQPPNYLKEDMTVSIDIEVNRHADAIIVAISAVRDASTPKPYVLLVVDGKAIERSVTLGARGLTSIEILTGLADGDKLVPTSAAGVSPGSRVRLRMPGAGS